MPRKKKKIGEILVASGAMSQEELKQTLAQQRTAGAGRRLGDMLVWLKLITTQDLARALATQHGLPFIQLPEIPPKVVALVPVTYQTKHRVVPFRLEGEGSTESVHLAVEDPSRMAAAVEELRLRLRKQIHVHVAASDDIENTLAVLRGEKVEELETEPFADVVEEPGAEPFEDVEEMEIERDVTVVGRLLSMPDADHAKKAAAIDAVAASAWSPPSVPAVVPAPPAAQPETAIPSKPAKAKPESPLDEALAEPAPVTRPKAVEVVKFPPRKARKLPPPPPEEDDWVPTSLPKAAAPGAVPPPPPADALPPPPADALPPPPPEDALDVTPPPAPMASAAPATASLASTLVSAVSASPAPGNPADPPIEPPGPKLEISEADLRILDDLEQASHGKGVLEDGEKIRPSHMVSSLIRLLIKKGVIDELELFEELARK